jgi:hypothetical protein
MIMLQAGHILENKELLQNGIETVVWRVVVRERVRR